jgi:hypothetical protein
MELDGVSRRVSSLPEPHMEHGAQHGVSRQSTSLFDWGGHLFVPTAGPLGWRARSSQGRPVGAAAKRLGLDLIEHAIRLLERYSVR